MGKITNTLLGVSLVGLCFLGWCTRKGSTKINEQKETIDSLETKVEKYSGFAKQLEKEKTFYSGELHKISNLYNKNLLENEKLKVYGLYQKEISKNKELNSLLGKNSASTEKGY